MEALRARARAALEHPAKWIPEDGFDPEADPEAAEPEVEVASNSILTPRAKKRGSHWLKSGLPGLGESILAEQPTDTV